MLAVLIDFDASASVSAHGLACACTQGNSWYVFTIDGETSKIYPCNEDSCGNGYHDPKGAGRRRLLHHVDPEDKL